MTTTTTIPLEGKLAVNAYRELRKTRSTDSGAIAWFWREYCERADEQIVYETARRWLRGESPMSEDGWAVLLELVGEAQRSLHDKLEGLKP